MPPRRARRPVTVRPPRQLREHPSLSDATLIMTMEDMIHATFGSEECNTVDFKLFETVLTVLGRRLNLLDQKVSVVDIDVGDEDKHTDVGVESISPYPMSGQEKSSFKEDATYVLLSQLTNELSEKVSKEQKINLDTASVLDLLDNNSKIKLYGLIENIEDKTEAKFLMDEYLKPFLDNLRGKSDSTAITIDLEDKGGQIEKSDHTSKKTAMGKSFEKEYHVLGSEVVGSAERSPPPKRKNVEEEALATLGLLRSTFPVKKLKHFMKQAHPGTPPPQGWPANLPWLPKPGTPWPKDVSWPAGFEPPPPSGWPEGMPWPPKRGTKWPPGVSWPDESDKPLGWPENLPWPPTPGTPWPKGVSWPAGFEPPPPSGWPEGMPWPPKRGTKWPPGVSWPDESDKPLGWPENLPWPPTPGTPWPKGVSWPAGFEPPPPSGWPEGMPWPPQPGTKWPPGVSWPDESDKPLGWPENLPWPPTPGTPWPKSVSWPAGFEPPPPPGWPEGIPWPPKPGTKWPPGVSRPDESDKPLGWPENLPWPPTPGTPWPKGIAWPAGFEPPPPSGWPEGMPWPPKPGTKWPPAVSWPDESDKPLGWPENLPWPPLSGTPWPSGVSWPPGTEPPRPHNWPSDMPWPPPPGTMWPSGVSWAYESASHIAPPPKGWPAGLKWPPDPGTPWPAEVSVSKDMSPPIGWPKGMPWPPSPGTKWPDNVKIPKAIKPPAGWPKNLAGPSQSGTTWPPEANYGTGGEPLAPPGWPKDLPWPPPPATAWPEGVIIPKDMPPPAGWPKELEWPPLPGTGWPSGKPHAPPGWPKDLPWPPPPATAWPEGVSIPADMAAPQGWPAHLPWPPQPGTSWPSEATWPDIGVPLGWPLTATARRQSKLQLTDEGDTIIAQRVPSRISSKTSTRVGGVECATASEFELLKKTVHDLQKITGPIPLPTMPVNQKLLKEVTAGSASLTDTMEAMKVVSRVQAMEEAVGRLSEMVSDLAAGIGKKAKDQELQVVKPSRSPTMMDAPSPRYHQVPAGFTKPSAAAMDVPCVTRDELAYALASLRERLSQDIVDMKLKITTAADTSLTQGKIIMDKLEEVVTISVRINALHEIVAEYFQQLDGMESGITIQIKTFHEQLSRLRNDLDCGLALLANVNSNKETLAVMDLTERYEGLVGDLDGLLHLHSSLDEKQRSIADELRHLIHAVERVSEQKADHDELADGLKDKADQSTLAGLLTEEDFLKAMDGIKDQLEACYVKFNKQDNVWHEALNDLLSMIDQKADYSQVFSWKDQTLDELQKLHCQVKLLAMAVGEPKAALVARRLAVEAHCGACAETAFMETEESHKEPHPAIPEDAPCIGSYKKLFEKQEDKRHFCKRWVGGSHTMISPSLVTRGRAETPDYHVTPMRRYPAQGKDGKLYQCASEKKPCEECNVLHPTPRDAPTAPAAADSGAQRTSIREVMAVGDQPQIMASEQTVVPVEDFIQTTPERHSSGVAIGVRGVNSSLDIVATHGNVNSDRLN